MRLAWSVFYHVAMVTALVIRFSTIKGMLPSTLTVGVVMLSLGCQVITLSEGISLKQEIVRLHSL